MSEDGSSSADSNEKSEESPGPQLPPQSGGENAAAATFFEMMTLIEKERGRETATRIEERLERAADYAHEWMLEDERSFALEELARHLLAHHNNKQALKVITRLGAHQTKVYGSEHAVLAKTYVLLGKCHRQIRDYQGAVKSLREAVVRYQCSDQLNLAEFVEALCTLSQVYREQDKPDLAKTAIKQALAVVSAQDPGAELSQARLLDEYGSLLYDTHQFAAAIPVICQAIGLKQDALGKFHFACVNSFVSLGMTYYSTREFELAENAMVQAALICQMAKCDDKALKADIFYKLAGTLRVMGRLAEAGIIEDAAKEVTGGQTEICFYEAFRKDFEAGYAAEKAEMWDNATRSYRRALTVLESFRHRNTADRIAVLIRLQVLAEDRKQKVQSTTLLVEIDQELSELFGSRKVEPVETARQLSRMFRIQGKNVAADAFLLYAERELKRLSDSDTKLIELYRERSQVLMLINQDAEADRLEKEARLLELSGRERESASPADDALL